jgi:hypothetical protein
MLAVRPKMRNSEKILIVLYIWIVLILTWIPTFTIVPFFYDTNSGAFIQVYSILNTIYTVGNIVYNFYFTSQCLIVLNRIAHRMKVQSINTGTQSLHSVLPSVNEFDGKSGADNSQSATFTSLKKIRIIAIKSIGHTITSSFAILFYAYGGPIGFNSWPMFIITGLHLWFNVRLEVYFCPVEPRAMKTRNEREREVRVGRAEECAQM